MLTTGMPRWMLIGFLSVALLGSAACSTKTRYLTVRLPAAASLAGQPLPLSAALLLPESIKTASQQEQINCPFNTIIFVLQTGAGFEKGALQVLSQAFSRVDAVRDKSAMTGQHELLIDVTAPELTLEGHCNVFSTERPTMDAKALLHVRVTDRKDQLLLDNTYTSSVHTEERVSEAVGKAIVEALQNMAIGLPAAPKIRAYAQGGPDAVAERKSEDRARNDTGGSAGDALGRGHITGEGFAVGYGYIVTAYHVVAGMSQVGVYLQDNVIPAAVVLRDRLNDMALLKVVEGSDRPVLTGLKLGDPTQAKKGDRVWTLEPPSPGSREKPTVREGVITAVTGPSGEARYFQISLQTTFSGAPIFNDHGEVIGTTVSPRDGTSGGSQDSAQDGHAAIKVQYAKALLALLPESEFVFPPATTRSVMSASRMEAVRPQVVFIKAVR